MKSLFGLFLLALSCFSLFMATSADKSPACLQEGLRNGGLIACQAYIPSWSYSPAQDDCVHFIYGGCGGNDNRFPSKEECEKSCKN